MDVEYCWCGGEVGPREPGDENGVGCLEDIWHDWTEVTAPKAVWRKIEVKESIKIASDSEWHYCARNDDGNVVYTSEAFSSKSDAIEAARNEHCNRSNFTYLLEYPGEYDILVKETL